MAFAALQFAPLRTPEGGDDDAAVFPVDPDGQRADFLRALFAQDKRTLPSAVRTMHFFFLFHQNFPLADALAQHEAKA